MDAIIGKTLEDARTHFLSLHETRYKTAAAVDRSLLQTWIENDPENPISHSVKFAMAFNGLDDQFTQEMLEASMKFRVYAGILNRPVDYDTDNILSGGLCGCQSYDKESGGWPCKVPGNQSQADKWHERFGNGPACPFYKNPNPESPLARSESEMEKMVFEEEKDVDEALRQLGLRHR